jgi:hypothetical protein
MADQRSFITRKRDDKRFQLAVGIAGAVLLLVWAGKAPGDSILDFLLVLVLGFFGQSQAGQTIRAVRARFGKKRLGAVDPTPPPSPPSGQP